MPTLRDLGEFETLRRLLVHAGSGPDVVVGAGDDAAVVRPRPGFELVVTTDGFIEGVHYRADLLTPAEIGARLATANLSDIAAMGAVPRWAVLSAGVRPDHDVAALEDLERALAEALAAADAALVGGNLAAVEGPEWWNLTVLGEVAAGRAWTRSGARPGDLVAVSGSPGFAAAGLGLASAAAAHGPPAATDPVERAMLDAWKRPRAEVPLAAALAATRAVSAAIDVSDGLFGDLRHLCEASRVGATIVARDLPNGPAIAAVAKRLGLVADTLRFGPGDDYVLLLAVDPDGATACAEAARTAGRPLTFIGRFTPDPAIRIRLETGQDWVPTGGYDHFAR